MAEYHSGENDRVEVVAALNFVLLSSRSGQVPATFSQ